MLRNLLSTGWMCLGLLQWYAIFDGLQYWLGISWFFSLMLSFFINVIPLAGTYVGFKGVVDVWGWSSFDAATLFLAPFFGLLILTYIIPIIAVIYEENRNKFK
jgi:hypothetical protein